MIYSATKTVTDFYCPREHPEDLFHHPRGRVHLQCLFKDFPRQTQVSGLSKLWLTFTLCAEERTSQCSCWRERKSLCVNSWGFLHFFIHNLQRNKRELYRRALESLNMGCYQIPTSHWLICTFSTSQHPLVHQQIWNPVFPVNMGHLEPWPGKTLQRVSLKDCTSFIISDSKSNHPHYSGNMNLVFATKNL